MEQMENNEQNMGISLHKLLNQNSLNQMSARDFMPENNGQL